MSKRKPCFIAAMVGVSLFYASLAYGQTAPQPQRSQTQTSNIQETIDGILRDFYNKYSLPGGISMAISYRERLVYAGAVGYADKDHKIPLTPEHRMRIASLSKPITSIAIMKLLEEKKISLDDFVFGKNRIFNNQYGMPTYRERHVDITVRQLLEHNTGGWGRDAQNSSGIRLRNIDRILENLPLEHLPGTHYDYSNFGYYVLGRIIETKSGMTYEDYVKEAILKPAGINGMRIGATRSGPDEVDYIATAGEDANSSTNWNPVNIDSAGGWIASPIELMKLLVRIDGFSNVKDILNHETIKIMTTRSKTNNRYALGWSLSQSGNNWYHSGGNPGISSIMARSSNGFNWAILINYRPPDAVRSKFASDMDDLFWQIHRTVKHWHTGTDLSMSPTITAPQSDIGISPPVAAPVPNTPQSINPHTGRPQRTWTNPDLIDLNRGTRQ